MPAARIPKTPRLAATPQMSREQQGLQECVEAADLPGAKAILEAQPPGTQRAWVNFPQERGFTMLMSVAADKKAEPAARTGLLDLLLTAGACAAPCQTHTRPLLR